VPINTTHTTVANALKKHMKTIPLGRKLLIAGDWNITLAARTEKIMLKNE
jgi:hypothetical protein